MKTKGLKDFKMDRTMYGKVDHGARHPYRLAMKDKGISPGCKSKVCEQMSFRAFIALLINLIILRANFINLRLTMCYTEVNVKD